ncbi:MAG: thioredoxin family protein [bacterium]
MQIILTDSNFQKEVLECPQPVVVKFSADWSGACHMMTPMIEELAKEFKGQIKICSLDIDDNKRVAKRYGICELPTFLFFKNSQVIDHIVGAIPKKILAARFKAMLQTES